MLLSGSGGNRGGSATTGGAVIERGGVADVTWDPVWEAAATITDSGWVAEMRIPFAQLRFGGAAVQTWGLQLERRIARKQEQSLFAFVPNGQPGGGRGLRAPRRARGDPGAQTA